MGVTVGAGEARGQLPGVTEGKQGTSVLIWNSLMRRTLVSCEGQDGTIGHRVGRGRGGGKATMGERGMGRHTSSTPRVQTQARKAL